MRTWILYIGALVLISGCFSGFKPAVQPDPEPGELPGTVQADPLHYDLVIKGGLILDGSGGPAVLGDVAVNGDKIARVGQIGAYTSMREIDATGLIVAPGFINPHSHTHDNEINPFEDWDATASLMQGITTEFGGVDGRSPIRVGEALDRIAKIGTGVNFGLFVGQGSIRGAVVGSAAGPATPDQMEQMKQLIRQAMEEGAFGLSTGLEYLPGSHADTEELVALVAESRGYGGIYSTHLRSEGDQMIPALEEALGIAQSAGVPLNLSHLKIAKHSNWNKADQIIKLIDQAILQGQKVFADVYPYLAPDYAVNRPLSEWQGAVPPQYLVITQATDGAMVGKTLAEVPKSAEGDPDLSVVALITSEQAMIRFYQSAWSVVSTDGESQPKLEDPAEALRLRLHRRSYGTYSQLLGHYLRDLQIVSLETMLRKMTGAVADNLGIHNRGYLKAGYYADIVLFDAATITDRTSWLRPQEYPTGVLFVFVNGQAAVDQGKRVDGRPGRVIRRSP